MRIFNPFRIKVASVLAAFAIVSLPASALATWGPVRPTFTWAHPATYVTFDSITDNPEYGDERPFLDVRDLNSAAVTDKITVTNNEELVLRVFFHNNASANLHLVSQNTRVKVLLPHTPSTATYAAGYIMSDNASPKVVTDTVDFVGPSNFTLSYEPGTAQLWTDAAHGLTMSDSIVTNSGALIGYATLDGKVPGCSAYEGFVTFKVRVSMPTTPTPQPPTPTPTPTHTATALPNTGPGDVVGLFAGASAAGGATHYFVSRRRK